MEGAQDVRCSREITFVLAMIYPLEYNENIEEYLIKRGISMSNYICSICDHIEECNELPKKCLNCGAPFTNLKILSEKEVE